MGGLHVAQRAMFCYPWDLAQDGVNKVAGALAARHMNSITLAGSYHAGKFLRPHSSRGKVYFPTDGTAYFKPEMARYGALKPVQNEMVDEDDVLADCCNLEGMTTTAWLVLLHNSRLGQLHPKSCVANAFGDHYIYSLCPSAPEVADYAVALCCDVTQNYAVDGITLETPGFLPFFHDYHHEFGMVKPNVWLHNMLGLCFCAHCVTGAQKAGINAEGLRQRVVSSLNAYLASDVDYEEDMAHAFWQAELVLDPDLTPFLKWRCGVVENLVTRIRAEVRPNASVSVIPSVARPSTGAWYEGSDLKALGKIADHLDICFYEPGPARIGADLHDVISKIGSTGGASGTGSTNGLRAILRPGYPDLQTSQSVAEAVGLLVDKGISDISFYNYGHMRATSLNWIGEALSAAGLGQ